MRPRVWVARSKRKTPPKWMPATSQTTSSVRSAVSTRSSPVPVATTTACSTSSSRLGRLSGGSGGLVARAGFACDRAPLRRRSDAPSPRSDAETAAMPTAPASAPASERAHQSQRRLAGPRCSRAGSKVQKPPPPSPKGRASHVSPPIAICPVRTASFQPAVGASSGVTPRARSSAMATSAGRDGRFAIAPSRASKLRPTTTMPACVGATPST